MTEVSKLIGNSWKTVSADTKAVYEEKSKRDKDRYEFTHSEIRAVD